MNPEHFYYFKASKRIKFDETHLDSISQTYKHNRIDSSGGNKLAGA